MLFRKSGNIKKQTCLRCFCSLKSVTIVPVG